MGYKQEPCPLCGRDMTAIETYPGRGELYCGHCDLTIGGNDAKTPEELIALMDSSEHRRLQAENAKLRELAVLNWEWAHSCCGNNCKMQTNDCGYQIDRECNYEREIWDRMRELGVDDG